MLESVKLGKYFLLRDEKGNYVAIKNGLTGKAVDISRNGVINADFGNIVHNGSKLIINGSEGNLVINGDKIIDNTYGESDDLLEDVLDDLESYQYQDNNSYATAHVFDASTDDPLKHLSEMCDLTGTKYSGSGIQNNGVIGNYFQTNDSKHSGNFIYNTRTGSMSIDGDLINHRGEYKEIRGKVCSKIVGNKLYVDGKTYTLPNAATISLTDGVVRVNNNILNPDDEIEIVPAESKEEIKAKKQVKKEQKDYIMYQGHKIPKIKDFPEMEACDIVETKKSLYCQGYEFKNGVWKKTLKARLINFLKED